MTWLDDTQERLRRFLDTDEGPLPPIGKYVVKREVGRGGMGVVFEAEDPSLKRRVALKVIRGGFADDELIARLHREAAITAQLQHPNIVAVHEVGTARDDAGLPVHYIAMDFIDGRTLADLIRDRRPLADLLRMLEEVARAVAHANAKGIVHRDLKPGNVLVDGSGRVFLADFGLAYGEAFPTRLTQSQAVMGTPNYMAPEQVEGDTRAIGPRTDVYALGAILYETLTGRPPFGGNASADIYRRILQEDPVRPARLASSVGRELEVICLKAMEKEPGRRYATALEFAEDIARFRRGEAILAHPPSVFYRLRKQLSKRKGVLAGTAAGLLVAAGLAVFFLWRARAELEGEQLSARRREEALKEVGALWTRVVRLKEWTRQSFRKPSEIWAEFEETERDVTRFIEAHPDMPQGRYVRARARTHLGDLAGAREDLEQATRQEPEFAPGWALLVEVLLDLCDAALSWRLDTADGADVARAHLDRAMEIMRRGWPDSGIESAAQRWGLSRTPEDDVGRVLLAAFKMRHLDKDREGAIRRLRAAFDAAPSEEYGRWLGQWIPATPERLEWLDRAIEIAPNDARAYRVRGIVRFLAGELRSAIEDLTKAIEINPRFMHPHVDRAMARWKSGDADGAIADATRAIEIEPQLWWAYLLRGSVCAKKGEPDRAIADMTKAIELHPRLAMAYLTRGALRQKKRDFDGAIADAARAIEIDPSNEDAYASRGSAYWAKGDRERAVADWEKALQLAPPDWPLRKSVEMLLRQAKGSAKE